jgi:hypothetical protein
MPRRVALSPQGRERRRLVYYAGLRAWHAGVCIPSPSLHLAWEIARVVVVEHGAPFVEVHVSKPGALRFADAVGVRIQRRTEDFPAAARGIGGGP